MNFVPAWSRASRANGCSRPCSSSVKHAGGGSARGKQRTASTHVLAAIRTINRLECAGETRRSALNALAVVAPDWLRAQVPVEWYERYGSRMEEYHLPKEASKRQALAEQIGMDGSSLLEAIRDGSAPAWLREVPAVEVLRRVWVQQFLVEGSQVRRLANDNIPSASRLISSPDDPEAHMSLKRSTVWTGDIGSPDGNL